MIQRTDDFGVGWINKDILASLGGRRVVVVRVNIMTIPMMDAMMRDDYDDLDMSGV